MSPQQPRILSGAGGTLLAKKRPGRISPFWRMVDAGSGVKRSPMLEQQWAMVLSARNIPYSIFVSGGRQNFYVPPLYEPLAREELRAYSAENGAKSSTAPAPPLHGGAAFCISFFIPLVLWQFFICDWQFFSLVPEQTYVQAGALDLSRVRIWHEWYRVVTALTLHSDANHLLGNVAFGSFFMFFLCRRTGFAPAVFLTMFGGALGNVLNVFLRYGHVVSLGYSTALFASIGALSGIMAREAAIRERRKAILPLAAGGALLAMLGTGGERTDYLAHIFGLSAGFILGLLARLTGRLDSLGRPVRVLLALASFTAPVICWLWALSVGPF